MEEPIFTCHEPLFILFGKKTIVYVSVFPELLQLQEDRPHINWETIGTLRKYHVGSLLFSPYS